MWVDKGTEFWEKDNDIEMNSTHNETKPVFAERFIGTLKNKIYMHITAVSKNAYISKLDDLLSSFE